MELFSTYSENWGSFLILLKQTSNNADGVVLIISSVIIVPRCEQPFNLDFKEIKNLKIIWKQRHIKQKYQLQMKRSKCL